MKTLAGMGRQVGLLAVSFLFLTGLAMAEPATVVVLAADAPTAETLTRELISTRERLGLKEDQLGITRLITGAWKPAQYRALGIHPEDLPMTALARLNARGKVVALVGYPDFVERNIAQPLASSERLVRRWAEAHQLASQPPAPPQPLIRAGSLNPEPGPQPIACGSEVLVTVQAVSPGCVNVSTSSQRVVPLADLGGGLYQGKYRVSAEEQGEVSLLAQYAGPQGETAEFPLGVFKVAAWSAPQIVSVNALGGDVYQVRGTAPPGSLVRARCHIDMGRFLFVGYPDFDGEWSVQADDRGEFTFNLDLNQAETRRAGDLDAEFTLYAENPQNPQQRTEESQHVSQVRMAYQRNYNTYQYGTGWGWGPSWGPGWGNNWGWGWGSGIYRSRRRCR